jgi:hypothetical protein
MIDTFPDFDVAQKNNPEGTFEAFVENSDH